MWGVLPCYSGERMNGIHEVKSSILSVSTTKIRQPKGCLFSLVETERRCRRQRNYPLRSNKARGEAHPLSRTPHAELYTLDFMKSRRKGHKFESCILSKKAFTDFGKGFLLFILSLEFQQLFLHSLPRRECRNPHRFCRRTPELWVRRQS